MCLQRTGNRALKLVKIDCIIVGIIVTNPWTNVFLLLDMSKGRLITDLDGNIIGNETPFTG